MTGQIIQAVSIVGAALVCGFLLALYGNRVR